jgi:N-acetylglucosaminyl-diphospho-decaprenol L-rhamnosyltransferase
LSDARLPVDVVVVTWNSRAMVLRCLESIDASAVEHVIVVDNASGDGTAEAVRDLHPEAEVVRLEREQGLASAYNRGAERGSAELLLFLNDDVLVDDSSLRALAAALRESSDAVAAAGRLVDPGDGHTQTEYLPRPFPTLSSYAAMLAGRTRPPAFQAQAPTNDEALRVDQPPGACLLVRREAFTAVGAWDEDFAFWYEDVDLARRLHSIGDVLFVPSAAFPHVGGHSAVRLSQADVVSRHYRGALLYAGKHFRAPSRLGAGLLFALVAAARLPFTRDRDSHRAYARVLRDGLRTAAGRPPVPR